MVSASHIREIVSNFASHRDPNRFVLEFSRVSIGINKNGSVASARLARAVEHCIAAVSVGHASVDSLLRAVQDAVDPGV